MELDIPCQTKKKFNIIIKENIKEKENDIKENEQEAREQDDHFMEIQQLIEAKKHMLLNKQKKLNFVLKQNKFLDVVKGDYEKFYGYINKQQQDQIKAFELLNEYIDNLTASGNLTKNNMEDAKEEQRKILKEIGSIKHNLNSLIDSTTIK